MALLNMASSIENRADEIVDANRGDMRSFRGPDALRDRLLLDRKRVMEMAASARAVATLADVVGEVVESWTTATGLEIERVRVPFGLVAVIYEARPNVTAEVAALALKSGNSILLRGGSEAVRSNKAIIEATRAGISEMLPVEAVQLVENRDRSGVDAVLRAEGLVDLVIPRGSAEFIHYVRQNSKVPFIETGAGNNHIFIDKDADLNMATKIVINAKAQRPSVCNAVRKLLVHKDVNPGYLRSLIADLSGLGVKVKGCERVRRTVPWVEIASPEDWDLEYMDLTIAIKIVDSLEEAADHIGKHSTKHSEAIITGSDEAASKFISLVDSSTVLVNASTRLVDGGVFGFGSEVGISTQKLHSRGPMGLRDLTTTKFVVRGRGHVRE